MILKQYSVKYSFNIGGRDVKKGKVIDVILEDETITLIKINGFNGHKARGESSEKVRELCANSECWYVRPQFFRKLITSNILNNVIKEESIYV